MLLLFGNGVVLFGIPLFRFRKDELSKNYSADINVFCVAVKFILLLSHLLGIELECHVRGTLLSCIRSIWS